MAFRDFFRGDREREEDERNRERWRSMGRDWRDEDRGRDQGHEYRGSEHDYRGGSERGWSPGSEYYSERSQGYRNDYGSDDYTRSGQGGYGGQSGRGGYGQGGYGQGYGQSYGQGSSQRGSGQSWRDEDRYGGESGGGSGSSVYGRYYGGGASAYTGSGYGERSRGQSDYGRGAGSGGYSGYSSGSFGASGYGSGMGSETGERWGQSSQQWGEHRGKGPRGYRRSDERIKEEVCDCLTDDPRIDASNLEVTVKDCEVTLSGSVNTREEKRLAEDVIERISGVKDVTNNLRVAQQQQTQTTTGENRASPSARH